MTAVRQTLVYGLWDDWWMNDQLERTGKESVVTKSKKNLLICLEDWGIKGPTIAQSFLISRSVPRRMRNVSDKRGRGN